MDMFTWWNGSVRSMLFSKREKPYSMVFGGMDKQVENTEKLATGFLHVVTGGDSALLASCIAVSFQLLLYEQTHFNLICSDRETTVSVAFPLPVPFCMNAASHLFIVSEKYFTFILYIVLRCVQIHFYGSMNGTENAHAQRHYHT